MEINLNLKSNAPLHAVERRSYAPPAGPLRDRVGFENLQALAQRLDFLPVLRPEAVVRGQELLSGADYPPERMMQSIATLLAIHRDQ